MVSDLCCCCGSIDGGWECGGRVGCNWGCGWWGWGFWIRERRNSPPLAAGGSGESLPPLVIETSRGGVVVSEGGLSMTKVRAKERRVKSKLFVLWLDCGSLLVAHLKSICLHLISCFSIKLNVYYFRSDRVVS